MGIRFGRTAAGVALGAAALAAAACSPRVSPPEPAPTGTPPPVAVGADPVSAPDPENNRRIFSVYRA